MSRAEAAIVVYASAYLIFDATELTVSPGPGSVGFLRLLFSKNCNNSVHDTILPGDGCVPQWRSGENMVCEPAAVAEAALHNSLKYDHTQADTALTRQSVCKVS